jgi:hypothetical protein
MTSLSRRCFAAEAFLRQFVWGGHSCPQPLTLLSLSRERDEWFTADKPNSTAMAAEKSVAPQRPFLHFL